MKKQLSFPISLSHCWKTNKWSPGVHRLLHWNPVPSWGEARWKGRARSHRAHQATAEGLPPHKALLSPGARQTHGRTGRARSGSHPRIVWWKWPWRQPATNHQEGLASSPALANFRLPFPVWGNSISPNSGTQDIVWTQLMDQLFLPSSTPIPTSVPSECPSSGSFLSPFQAQKVPMRPENAGDQPTHPFSRPLQINPKAVALVRPSWFQIWPPQQLQTLLAPLMPPPEEEATWPPPQDSHTHAPSRPSGHSLP